MTTAPASATVAPRPVTQKPTSPSIISACGTGKSWGIALVVDRDAAHFITKYSGLITRTTFHGLNEIQGLLWRYLTVAFPGTT